MGEEKKIEIENAEQLAEYIGKLIVLQRCGYTPEKKWSYSEGRLIPYSRDAPVHVFFDVHTNKIKVIIESEEDVSEFDIEVEFTIDEGKFKKEPNLVYYMHIDSKYISYKQAWAIAYRNLKKLRKIYGEDKYIIIPYAFSGRRRNYAYTFVFPKSLLLNYANRIYNEISRLLQEEQKEEVTEEISVEISVEEALAGWTESVPTAVGTVEEIIEKAEEKKEEIERSFEEEVNKLGLVRAKLVTFTNPSEYLGSSRKRKGLLEEITFRINPEEVRKKRVLFYEALRNIAFRTDMGWVMYRKIEKEELDRLNERVEELNKLVLGRHGRAIYILDVFVPKNYIIEKLRENIMRKRARIEELEQKLREIDAETEKKVIRRLKRDLRDVQREVKRLEEELKYYS